MKLEEKLVALRKEKRLSQIYIKECGFLYVGRGYLYLRIIQYALR